MKKTRRKPAKPGFALIVTVSLMILLTVVAVGLLSVASISLRSSGNTSATAMARSNARLALMLALGDLQVTLGQDRAASATASTVSTSPARPRLLGAWGYSEPRKDDWHWAPKTSGAPSYTGRKDTFKRWLVSAPDPTLAATQSFASNTPPTVGADGVNVVGDADITKALKDSQGVSTTVVVNKVKVKSSTQTGKFGYAVFDESQKAAIDIGDPTTTMSGGVEIASRTAPFRERADILENTLSAALKAPVNLFSMESANVPLGSRSSELTKRFHDFTTGSVGLLTNSAYGGLRRDLTSIFEAETLPANSFPTPYVYPAGFETSGIKWDYLRDHYRKYIKLTAASDLSSAEASYPTASTLVPDLTVNPSGLDPAPAIERLLPVITKFQLAFSLVAHWPHIAARKTYLNTYGLPKDPAAGGNAYQKWGAIHLAYDPVITLYNPYDVTLNLAKLRIRVWDPPVGFKFTKTVTAPLPGDTAGPVPFRDPSRVPDSQGFEGLAKLQIKNQDVAAARKFFTLYLTDGTSEASGGTLKLRPGEVKVFSPRVQDAWTWGVETQSEYDPSSFFDWNADSNFGNVDKRTSNQFGVEAVPGWRAYAGLQTDHLAHSNPRYGPSKYGYENAAGSATSDGFVTLRYADKVKIECRPMVTSGASVRNFQIDILAGKSTAGATDNPTSVDPNNSTVSSDTLRSFKFNFANTSDISAELAENPAKPIIDMEQFVSDILQTPSEKTTDHKRPFAMLEMSARTPRGALNDGKPWLYNNFVVEGGEQNSATVGLAMQSYDLRLKRMTSFLNDVSIDARTGNGYFGTSDRPIENGESFVPMFHIPLAPAASLGDMIAGNLAPGSLLPRVMHPFGNGRGHPLIPAAGISKTAGYAMFDHSYLLNEALWDSYFCSSLCDYTPAAAIRTQNNRMLTARTLKEVLGGVFLSGTQPPLNNRLAPLPSDISGTAVVDKLVGMTALERGEKLGTYVGIKGPFNVNSTSIDAWIAVLTSMRERAINGFGVSFTTTGTTTTVKLTKTSFPSGSDTPLVRTGAPLAGAIAANQAMGWGGFRTITDAQIKTLATSIVREIKSAANSDGAPSLTLSDFVNRRPGSSVHQLAGLIQAAIDSSDVNNGYTTQNGKAVNASSIPGARKAGMESTSSSVLDGMSQEGTPPMVTQGDIMAGLAPIATTRGDTFTIRAYGEALDKSGNNIVARAWCEAVVQRNAEFVNPTEVAETKTADLKSTTNKYFGRKFTIRSFRWLNEKEV